jgi:hypothetical protein
MLPDIEGNQVPSMFLRETLINPQSIVMSRIPTYFLVVFKVNLGILIPLAIAVGIVA